MRSFWRERYRQQVAWSRDVRRDILNEIGSQPDWRLLEIGSGYGALLHVLADEGYGQVYGLDIDLGALLETEGGFPLMCADGRHISLISGLFDVCICHFLLLWVKNPLIALAEMVRVTKPGGWLIILAEPDYGGRIDYPNNFEKVGSNQSTSLNAQGADIYMGRQLAGLLQKAGLKQITCGVLPARWKTGEKQYDALREWQVLEMDLQGQMNSAELDELKAQEMKAWTEGKRVTYVPTFYGFGQVK